MRNFLAALSGLIIVAGAATAAAPAKHTAKTAPAVKLVCPVTGETIASKKLAAGHSDYKGKTYYFCCAGCKPAFDKDPAKFTKAASAKVSPSTIHHM